MSELRELFMRGSLEGVAVDADDTLWYDARYFRRLKQALLDCCVDLGLEHDTLLSVLAKYERTGPPGEAGYVAAIRAAARELHVDPRGLDALETECEKFVSREVELIDGVEEALSVLQPVGVNVVTKGNPDEQARKLARSGLADLVVSVQILEHKSVDSWRAALSKLARRPRAMLVIGNSVEHDIRPAMAVGAAAIWLNHHENSFGRNGDLPKGALEVSTWSEIADAAREVLMKAEPSAVD